METKEKLIEVPLGSPKVVGQNAVSSDAKSSQGKVKCKCVDCMAEFTWSSRVDRCVNCFKSVKAANKRGNRKPGKTQKWERVDRTSGKMDGEPVKDDKTSLNEKLFKKPGEEQDIKSKIEKICKIADLSVPIGLKWEYSDHTWAARVPGVVVLFFILFFGGWIFSLATSELFSDANFDLVNFILTVLTFYEITLVTYGIWIYRISGTAVRDEELNIRGLLTRKSLFSEIKFSVFKISRTYWSYQVLPVDNTPNVPIVVMEGTQNALNLQPEEDKERRVDEHQGVRSLHADPVLAKVHIEKYVDEMLQDHLANGSLEGKWDTFFSLELLSQIAVGRCLTPNEDEKTVFERILRLAGSTATISTDRSYNVWLTTNLGSVVAPSLSTTTAFVAFWLWRYNVKVKWRGLDFPLSPVAKL